LLATGALGIIGIKIFSKLKGGQVLAYKPFYMNVARETIDPYLIYRTLYPGYESWGEMKIVQRSVKDFKESSLVENQLLEGNCVNCHSFARNKPDKYLIHVRGSKSGTYFIDNNMVIRRELKTKEMPGNAVYPAWHPSGKYVAFSSNMIFSVIHMHSDMNLELYDRYSILVIFDIEKNEISVCGKNYKGNFMETYPVWSPDGKYLYYCRTSQVKPGFDYRQVKYDVARMSFDKEKGIFGSPEVILNAQVLNKSASFPAISPDGLYLVATLHDFGTFPNWHREADLYSLSLKNGKLKKMSLNSMDTESYSSWSRTEIGWSSAVKEVMD
jgi:Tol biopolymer transport system component